MAEEAETVDVPTYDVAAERDRVLLGFLEVLKQAT